MTARCAVRAAKIACFGYRKTQVIDGSSKRISHSVIWTSVMERVDRLVSRKRNETLNDKFNQARPIVNIEPGHVQVNRLVTGDGNECPGARDQFQAEFSA